METVGRIAERGRDRTLLCGDGDHRGHRRDRLEAALSRQGRLAERPGLIAEPGLRVEVKLNGVEELLETGEAAEVFCYNLPRELGLTGANPSYAAQLSRLAEALQFDSAYVEEIAAFGQVS